MGAAYTGYMIRKILDDIVAPDLITNIEAPYDRGRLDERIRIRNGIAELLADEKIVLPKRR